MWLWGLFQKGLKRPTLKTAALSHGLRPETEGKGESQLITSFRLSQLWRQCDCLLDIPVAPDRAALASRPFLPWWTEATTNPPICFCEAFWQSSGKCDQLLWGVHSSSMVNAHCYCLWDLLSLFCPLPRMAWFKCAIFRLTHLKHGRDFFLCKSLSRYDYVTNEVIYHSPNLQQSMWLPKDYTRRNQGMHTRRNKIMTLIAHYHSFEPDSENTIKLW